MALDGCRAKETAKGKRRLGSRSECAQDVAGYVYGRVTAPQALPAGMFPAVNLLLYRVRAFTVTLYASLCPRDYPFVQ